MSESIYNLIPQQEREARKPAMYRSKHDPTQPVDSSFSQKKQTRRLEAEKPDPKQFLTRNAGLTRTQSAPADVSPSQRERPARQSLKPSVPTRAEKPIFGLQSQKDFIVGNAVENILAGAWSCPSYICG
jgi:hypothetical protein